MNDRKPIIKMTYINREGIEFPHVKEYAFCKENLKYMGKCVAQTNRTQSLWFSNPNDLDGVYIYKPEDDAEIAYRIYKEFACEALYTIDDEMIEKLMSKQDQIDNVKFPFGVVTLDGRVIGQVIPFFENTKTLYEYSRNKELTNNPFAKDPIKIYREILIMLKEMMDHDIYYYDNHAKNFMMDPSGKIELIDFDPKYTKFSDYNDYYKKKILAKFSNMVNQLNQNLGIEQITGPSIESANIEDTFYQLDEMEKKLVRK